MEAAEHSVEGDFGAITVHADGRVWLKSHELCWTDETSAGCTSWPDVFDGADYGMAGLVVADDGLVWLTALADEDGSVTLLRFDGTEWQVVPTPADYPGDPTPLTHPVGMTRDGGTVWTAGDPFVRHQSLTRLDEQGWTTFTAADGVRTWGGQRGEWNAPTDTLRVAPGGSAWVNASIATASVTDPSPCGRPAMVVACFAGVVAAVLRRALSDALRSDGSAWVVALDRQSGEVSTYVITPGDVSTREVASGPFPAGEPVDLVFISDSSGWIVASGTPSWRREA